MSTPAEPARTPGPDGPDGAGEARESVVIKISPMAHFAVFFLALGLLSVVFAAPDVFAVLLLIPVLLSAAVVRYRTTVDRDGFTARTLIGSTTGDWKDVDGLRFDRKSWALARLRDGSEVRLPAVTFATLPRLTAATGGRVPNPYSTNPDTETDAGPEPGD